MDEYVCTDCNWTGGTREEAEKHEQETGHVTVRREGDWCWSENWGN